MDNKTLEEIRKDFPSLQMEVYGKPMVFLDSAASSLKPLSVINAIADYYKTINSNVHRGSYKLSQLASDAFDKVREDFRDYLNASSIKEIIYTKGTTEAINLIAHGLSSHINEGDHIVLTEMEHHANIIPWQRICKEKKAELKVIPVEEDGTLNTVKLKQLISEKTKVLGITHISNVLGTINPLKEIIELAHRFGALVVVDGAQGIVHGPVDVKDLDCDFYCFSGHKMYGPMGIGVLYGKEAILNEMEPYQLGGAMIDRVSFKHTTYKGLPHKFEAGTPNVSAVIGLGKALEYLKSLGWKRISSIEDELMHYAEAKIKEIDGIRIIGTADNKAPICSLVADDIHPYDIGTIIDKFGIACRTGNHCTQPLHESLGISGTVRASFAFYNKKEEIDLFIESLGRTLEMLR